MDLSLREARRPVHTIYHDTNVHIKRSHDREGFSTTLLSLRRPPLRLVPVPHLRAPRLATSDAAARQDGEMDVGLAYQIRRRKL